MCFLGVFCTLGTGFFLFGCLGIVVEGGCYGGYKPLDCWVFYSVVLYSGVSYVVFEMGGGWFFVHLTFTQVFEILVLFLSHISYLQCATTPLGHGGIN